jgi:hypothetical protein
MTMGDSITLAAESGGESYRAELGRLLDQAGVAHRFVIAAHGGWGCRDWVPLAQNLVATERPDVVLLNCGTNDGGLPDFEGQYYWLINNLLSGNGWGTRVMPSWVMYSAVPPGAAWLRDSEPRANDAIYRVIVPSVWKAQGRVVNFANTGAIPEAYLDSGGVHPTTAGYTAMGRLWFEALRPVYGLPDIAPKTCGLTGRRPGGLTPAYLPCTVLAG